MAETDLIKTVSVLEIALVDAVVGVTFAAVPEREDDVEGYISDIVITTEAWKDMGKPSQITVSVEPGDKLNEAGEMAGFLRTMQRVYSE